MALLDSLTELFRRDATRVVPHKIGMDGPAAVAGRHYVQIWLAAMHLTRDRDWFQTQFPAVSSVVSAQFGTTPQFEFPNVIDSAELFKPRGNAPLIVRNVILTPIMPFRGGSVKLSAGLRRMVVSNYLTEFVSTLSKFAGLLTVTQVSSALQVAGPLAEGIQKLFAGPGGETVLGYQETFDANSLRSGHVAVVNAAAAALDTSRLSVRDGQLLCDGNDLTQYDYMLIEVKVFDERDDCDELLSILTPLELAIKAIAAGKEDDARQHLNGAIAAALLAPELTNADRRRVIDRVKERYRVAKSGFESATGAAVEPVSLQKLMKTGPSAAAVDLSPITRDEAFQGY
jgi:hypothetical protein